MERQGKPEPTGKAKITKGYNLPAKYVLHTVGPIVRGQLTEKDRTLLAACYRSCLELADAYELKSIAFCCISTGEFHFPNEIAGQIAVVYQLLPDFIMRENVLKSTLEILQIDIIL